MRAYFLTPLFIVMSASLWGQVPDTLYRNLKNEYGVRNFVRSITKNPSLMSSWGKYSFSTVEAHYGKSENEAYAKQFPSGAEGFGVRAESFLRYKNGKRLWGSASYQNQKEKDLHWNESIDRTLIYPYFTADSIGGDMQTERYAFAGGYLKHYKRFGWGATLNYAAELASRNRDPRPKNISSDLRIKAGGALRDFHHLTLALHGSFEKYTQSNDLKFFSEMGQPPVYHLNGLGYYNNLLKGNHLRGIYDGYGYGAGAQVVNQRGDWYLAVDYGHLQVEKYIPDENNVVASTLVNSQWNAEITKLFHKKSYAYGLKLSYSDRQKAGIEPLLSARNSNGAEVLSTHKNYTLKAADYRLSLIFISEGESQLLISPYVSYQTHREDYTLIESFEHFSYLAAGLHLSYTQAFQRKHYLCYILDWLSRRTLSKEYLLRNDSQRSLSQMLADNAQYLSSDEHRLTLGIEYNHRLHDNLSLFTRVGSAIALFPKRVNYLHNLSIGIHF